jgi:thiol-disulfide isomerase/thioredoxin
MSGKNHLLVHLKSLVATLGLIILAGCNRTGTEIIPSVAPTASSLQTQVVTTSEIPIATSPDQAYPSPATATMTATVQDLSPYPSPIDAIQPVASSTSVPTLTPVGNSSTNPYPLQDTPAQQDDGLSNPSAYPPPVAGAPIITTAHVATSTIPEAAGIATPTPRVSAAATITPVLTPHATMVKTRFVASDPSKVDLIAGRPQLVVFFANWCTLCKSIAPVVLGIEDQYGNQMNFIYLDIDDEETRSLQTKLNYTLIGRPRVYLIDGQGVILRDWTGYVAFEELLGAISPYITITPTILPPTLAPSPTVSP